MPSALGSLWRSIATPAKSISKPERVLDADRHIVGAELMQQASKPVDRPDVSLPGRAHLEYLPRDQLHRIILHEDAGLGHPMVLVHCEAPPREIDAWLRRCDLILCRYSHEPAPTMPCVAPHHNAAQWAASGAVLALGQYPRGRLVVSPEPAWALCARVGSCIALRPTPRAIVPPNGQPVETSGWRYATMGVCWMSNPGQCGVRDANDE